MFPLFVRWGSPECQILSFLFFVYLFFYSLSLTILDPSLSPLYGLSSTHHSTKLTSPFHRKLNFRLLSFLISRLISRKSHPLCRPRFRGSVVIGCLILVSIRVGIWESPLTSPQYIHWIRPSLFIPPVLLQVDPNHGRTVTRTRSQNFSPYPTITPLSPFVLSSLLRRRSLLQKTFSSDSGTTTSTLFVSVRDSIHVP